MTPAERHDIVDMLRLTLTVEQYRSLERLARHLRREAWNMGRDYAATWHEAQIDHANKMKFYRKVDHHQNSAAAIREFESPYEGTYDEPAVSTPVDA